MKLVTALMLLTASFTFGAEEAKPKPIEDVLWEKAVSDNTKEVEKAFSLYQKALADATSKVTKALEQNIKDLNDSKKFPKLGMKERVDAIKALEEKIKGAKEAVGESVVASKSGDLLGDGSEVDIKKMIVGKWTLLLANNNRNTVEVDKNLIITLNGNSGWKTKINFTSNTEMEIKWNEKETWFINYKDESFIMGMGNDFNKLVKVGK